MKTSIIGYTGFVGSNIIAQYAFDHLYCSSNIHTIKNRSYDLVVCAGVRAEKWKANQKPRDDWSSIQNLINNLKNVTTRKFVLISTVDIYPTPCNVDELTNINADNLQPYGKHRFYLEQLISAHFADSTIVRLPALFGKGIKKNFIYDLIHNERLNLTHYKSQFQFYNLDNIWKDIQIAIKNSLAVINLATEPVNASEVMRQTLNVNFFNETKLPPVIYDMHTVYGRFYQTTGHYLYHKEKILNQLKEFVNIERKALL